MSEQMIKESLKRKLLRMLPYYTRYCTAKEHARFHDTSCTCKGLFYMCTTSIMKSYYSLGLILYTICYIDCIILNLLQVKTTYTSTYHYISLRTHAFINLLCPSFRSDVHNSILHFVCLCTR